MKIVRLKPRESIFVCGKCLKKHSDGKTMRSLLKVRAKALGAKIIRTSCLGPCPKHAVTIATRESLGSGTVILWDGEDAVADALPDRTPLWIR